jgi:hypothetical protein
MEHPWEDNLLERKVESDLKDLLKTLVAFANSVKPGHVATILIGERDDGSVDGVTSPESIQARIRKECDRIYPAIIWRSTVYEKDVRSCVRVEIEYGGDTPHFGGIAWVRRGASTEKATDEVFQKLIELRLNMVRELSQWLNKDVSIHGDPSTVPPEEISGMFRAGRTYFHRWPWESTAKILFVNRYWITLQNEKGEKLSEPLRKLTLTYDNEHDRLKLIVSY